MEFIPKSVEEAPLRLKLVSGLIFVTGLFTVVLAVMSILFRNPMYSKYAFMMVVGGIINIALAFGLIKGERFAWIATVAVETVYLIVTLWAHRWLVVVISALILAALLTSSNYFGIPLFGKSTKPTGSATPASVIVNNSKYFRKVKP